MDHVQVFLPPNLLALSSGEFGPVEEKVKMVGGVGGRKRGSFLMVQSPVVCTGNRLDCWVINASLCGCGCGRAGGCGVSSH